MLLPVLESWWWYEVERRINRSIDDYAAPNKEVIELSESSPNLDASVTSQWWWCGGKMYRVSRKQIQMRFVLRPNQTNKKSWNDVAECGKQGAGKRKGKNISCIFT